MKRLLCGDGNIIKAKYRDSGIYSISFEHPNEAFMVMELNKKEVEIFIENLKNMIAG